MSLPMLPFGEALIRHAMYCRWLSSTPPWCGSVRQRERGQCRVEREAGACRVGSPACAVHVGLPTSTAAGSQTAQWGRPKLWASFDLYSC